MIQEATRPRLLEIGPQPGPQEAFLASPADVVIGGGAAGGGKTFGLLLETLRHINNPGFGAVIFRRTSPQITNQGGLWDESAKLYPLLGATANRGMLQWGFRGGARVSFRHLQYEHNIYDWQGAQIPLIGFDELTHFTEKQFFYLLSRNRSVCGVRPYLRATTNPDAESWVARLIAWWIDQDTGYAIPERSGVIRYFLRVNEELRWGDTREELLPYVPRDIPEDERAFAIKSFTFIPALLSDNPILMAADPGYLANLLAQPLVERERLLKGNWKIVPAGGKVFNRYWFEIVEAAPAGGEEVRFWDFAATTKQLAGDDPDYTAAVKIRKVDGVYYVLDSIAEQIGPAAADGLWDRVTHQDAVLAFDSGAKYRVRWEEEPGAASKRMSAQMVRRLAGLDARPRRPEGDKISRAMGPEGFSAQAEAGNIKLVKGDWNEAWLTHMHHQPDWPHDDTMDASVGAFNDLARPDKKQGRSYQG